MAFYAIATQILNDGPRNTVVKVTGDVTAALPGPSTIVTASALTSMNPGMAGSFPPTLLRLDHIDYSITDGAICILQWDATTQVAITELYGRGKIEAAMWGGFQNNAGAGITGNITIQIEASGAAMPTETSILLVLKFVKYRPITVGGA